MHQFILVEIYNLIIKQLPVGIDSKDSLRLIIQQEFPPAIFCVSYLFYWHYF